MSTRDPHTPLTETTPEGEQTLIPGVRPITTRDRLSHLIDAPMRPHETSFDLF
ncbi:hypothetical protein [Mesorhizobium sp.]|uniref:hypothetical protein n=1 Tax=Mesorhizobium sp. TaxID=1871066 RepID=UPI0025841393|nr:hypothetical protein [Mesorhizobium sp.]